MTIRKTDNGILTGIIKQDLLKAEILRALGRASEQALQSCEAVLDGVTYGIDHFRGVVVVMDSPGITHLARGFKATDSVAELDQLDSNVTAYNVPENWRKEQA